MSNRLKDISYGIAAQESAGMHKLAKMLMERPFSRERLKMQALRYLITPQQLARRQAHKYGWLSVVPVKWLDHDKRAALAEEIRAIEADPALPPYERVGWIVRAIKEATGMRFVNDSAFRTMMNTKFNEYALADRLDEIHGVEDALRVMREADVAAKSTTLLGAQPEMFHRNRLTELNDAQTSAAVLLGGTPHQSGMSIIADFVQDVHRLRHTHFTRPHKDRREADLIEIAKQLKSANRLNTDVQRSGQMVLSHLRHNMPERVAHIKDAPGLDPSLGSFGNCKEVSDVKRILHAAFRAKQDVNGFFNSKIALAAVADTIGHGKLRTSDGELGWSDQRAYEDWVLRQIDYDRLRYAINADPLMEVVKKLRVDNASSYDTLLVNMARYPSQQRQPMVFAIDRLLGIDGRKDEASWRREAAVILKGASKALYPSNLALLAPNEALRSETREALHRSIGGQPDPDKEPATWVVPGGHGGFHTPSGMPSIIGLPVGVNDVAGKSLASDKDFELNSDHRLPHLRNREALLQFTAKQHADYNLRCNPLEITTAKAASIKPKKRGSIKDKPTLRLAKFQMMDMALLAVGETGGASAAQKFVQFAAARNDDYKAGKLRLDTKGQVALMNFSPEDLNTKDAFGNTALHDALRLSLGHLTSDIGDDLATAFTSAGATYAATNFYGVQLAEVIPLVRGSKGFLEKHIERQRQARADVMGANLMQAMGGDDTPAPEEDEAASDTRFAL